MTIKEKYRLKKFADFDPFSAETVTETKGWIPDFGRWLGGAISGGASTAGNALTEALATKSQADLNNFQAQMALANLAISKAKAGKNKLWRNEVISTPYSETFNEYAKRYKDDILKYPGLSNHSTDAMVNRMKRDNLKEILDNPNMLDKRPILGKNVEELLDPNLQFKLELDRQGKIFNNKLRDKNINLFAARSNISGLNDETGLRNYLDTAKANANYNLDKVKAGVNNSMKDWNAYQKELGDTFAADNKNLENAMKEIRAVSDKANGIKPTANAATVEAMKNDKGFMDWIKDKWSSLSAETKTALSIGGTTAAALTGIYGLYKTISAIMNLGSSGSKKPKKRRIVEEYDNDDE